MKAERKYHKIISLTLLLFFIITIQHYSSSLVGNVLCLDPVKTEAPNLIIPARQLELIPLLKDKENCCAHQLSSTTCSNKLQLKKNS